MEGTSSFLDLLKVKGSWGKLGSDALGGGARFLYLARYQTVANNYAFGGTEVPGLNPTAANPFVTWETSTKTDVGFEARFLKGLFGIEAEYFKEDRKNILATRSAQIPASYGGPLPAENIGITVNKGIELTLNVTPVKTNDFTWNFQYIFSRDWNKVV